MEVRHVKIDRRDALSGKKNLLSAEIDILNIQKKVRNYKVLRKKELSLKSKLKTNFGALKTKLNLFQTSLPKDSNHPKPQKKQKIIEKAHTKDIQDELNDIKSKLAQLD
jgi:hypothetical protein